MYYVLFVLWLWELARSDMGRDSSASPVALLSFFLLFFFIVGWVIYLCYVG